MEAYSEHRILIWGKTYPELSVKYFETVCTGGVLEDGKFVRLYPIPLRYLADNQKFTKYQWIRAKIKKSKEDQRPESYKIDPESIILEEVIPADKFRWHSRSERIFKNSFYQFSTMEALIADNLGRRTSMGFVKPRSIELIEVEERPTSDYETFIRKLKENIDRSQQQTLFDIGTPQEIKNLQYLSSRFKVNWRCFEPNCAGHKMSILDWEVYELARRNGIENTLSFIKAKLDLSQYDIGFFMGNLKAYPNRFTIGGIWYPQKNNNNLQTKLNL